MVVKGKVIQLITLNKGIKHDVNILTENELTIVKYANGHKEAIPVDVDAIYLNWGMMEKNVPTYIKAGNVFLKVTESMFVKTSGFTTEEVAAYTDTAIIVRGILGFWQAQQGGNADSIKMILALLALGFIAYVVITQLNIPIPFLTSAATTAAATPFPTTSPFVP
jgi:hypothetical protein